MTHPAPHPASLFPPEDRETSPSPAPLEPGIYRHHKGGRYLVLHPDVHAASDGHPRLVVYVSLTSGILWARDLHEWHDLVLWPDGVTRPRYVREETPRRTA